MVSKLVSNTLAYTRLDSLDFSVEGILCFTFDRSSAETSRAWRGADRTGTTMHNGSENGAI